MTAASVARDSVRPLWTIVLAAAAIAAIGMGLRQVQGLYMRPLTTELGLGRETFALTVAISNMVWGIVAPFAGAVADRHGAGRVVVMGGLATAAGLIALWQATNSLHLYVAGALMGLGVSGAGINALVGMVSRAATPHERTSAVAVIGMGSGIGILIALPYTHVLMEWIGWHVSLAVLALTALTIVPLALVVRGKPADAPGAPRQSAGSALREALAHPSFWLLNASFFVCGFHVVFYGTHIPAYVADQGLGGEVAIAALMAVGLGNLAGTWIAGEWGRTYSKRLGLACIYLGRAVIFLGFLVLPVTGATVIILSALLGLLWLSTIPLTSGLIATFFGPRWMTMLYGIVFLSHQAGSFFGAWLGGLVFDAYRSYDLMWWISVGLGLAAAVVSIPIVERPVVHLRTERA